MFDPKIFEGSWDFKYSTREIPDYEYIGPVYYNSGTLMTEYIDDAKAIAAVPELLEVYKAAKKYIDKYKSKIEKAMGKRYVIRFMKDMIDLSDAIKNLEDRHCEETDT